MGEVIDLEDFSAAEVAELNQRHQAPLDGAALKRLMSLLSGQPYLTRRAMYLVAIGRISIEDLFDKALEDRGPFGDHLRYHLFRIHDQPELVEGVRHVLAKQECPDDRVFFRLRGAGLVKREGGIVIPRCELYGQYLKERLHA